MNHELYTTTELLEMTPEELAVAQANDYVKPQNATEADVAPKLSVKPSLPAPPQDDPYAVTAWGSDLFDFRAPSGQLCQMRKLKPESMLESGMLDKVTRLPAFAEENIRKAQGHPPAAASSVSPEDFKQLIKVLDELLPIVVVQPQLWSEPSPERSNDDPELDNSERIPGRVYVSDVELADRVAIMERAIGGVKKLDNFRKKP